MDLSKNTVFITGGASGIGLALATEFLSLQNNVIVCGRNPEKLESVKNNTLTFIQFVVMFQILTVSSKLWKK